MVPSNHHSGPTVESSSDLNAVRVSAIDFQRAAAHFLDVARRATADQVELAGADLLRHAVTLARRLGHGLAELRVQYALLWARAQSQVEEVLEDDDGVVEWALDTFIQQLGRLQESTGGLFEGRSRDGKVSASIDDRMKLVELDFEPRLLKEPDYRASVIEAVNAVIEPGFRRRNSVQEALLDESGPGDEIPDAGGDDTDPIFFMLDILCVVEEAQNRVAQFLPRISGGRDPKSLAEGVDGIEEICLEAEQLLRDHLPSLSAYRELLLAKARVPDLSEEDLADVEGCERLFLDQDLDEFDEPVTVGETDISQEARELVQIVADELQRREDELEARLLFQIAAQRVRSQIAEVERQTFAAHSQDGSVIARADGSPRLIDLTLDCDHQSEPARVRAAVIEAINSAIEMAAHRRTVAAMIVPPG